MRNGINKYEYQILTNAWEGVGGAAQWQAWEFCKEAGMIKKTQPDGAVVPTEKGLRAMKEYQAEQSRKKGEAH